MVDFYKKKLVNHKSDIWALGCLLYKLCYFKTPFEDVDGNCSSLAILNVKYTLPNSNYSKKITDLISKLFFYFLLLI